MIRSRYPQADKDRLMLLESCAEQIARDVADTRAYIPAALATAIQAHILVFGPAVTRAMNMRGQRSVEVGEKQTAVAELDRYVRDYWNVLERRIVREKLPRGLFVEFDLLLGGDDPAGRSMTDMLKYADNIAQGEASIVAKGYAPMCNPSAAEVAAKRAAVSTESTDVIVADTALDEAQHTLEDARAEADKLIRFVVAQLDMALYGSDADDIRRIKERYGFKFEGETAVVEETAVGGDETEGGAAT
ncbi:MAG: hypothetical protein DRH37_09855 [Deltaproteobacteria bacterium]|nr:MAG: hypothetical protein DRH37_09855 [Deltaproteobacteria bacterium]